MAQLSTIYQILLPLLLIVQVRVEAAEPIENIIDVWAQEFGEELWRLTQTVTKVSEIKTKYKTQNAGVKSRKGEDLLDEIVDKVDTMLKSKVDSVKCIMKEAEDLAEQFDEEDRAANYSYYSSKASFVDGDLIKKKHQSAHNDLYKPMFLHPARYFNNIPVNFSHSSVHVPTNLFDRAPRVLDAIQWSEALNTVFEDNYVADPALSWQYFGDSSGFLRNFPAMKWNQEVDQYDYRFSKSYIEAATCSKDVVILMDTTGSMTGMRINIAKLTVSNILDTLSNNDYVNVFNFSDTAQEVVPCYSDMLVQATAENVNTFKEAVENLKPEGHGNFSVVFTQAFELLAKYREIRGCSNETGADGVQCNQVIMLVTDGVPYNITEVFEEYNWLDNGTYIPVRVFSFLIGREVFKVKEIQLIACLNRGYYTHVHSLNEVREGVFKYVPVLARPLVLQGVEHPITWSNVYADITDSRVDEWLWDVMENAEQKDRMFKYFRNKKLYFSQRDADRRYVQQLKKEVEELEGHIRYREYHLIVSVTIPAFDRKINHANYTRNADLLGVAGTDIYLDHIQSLTMPYKIGVNGYAFIINNNGYILLHPELRPVSRGALKDNFNSVDLTEVELFDDERETRELSPEIVKLREAMINQSTGSLTNKPIKYHYDDMHRVAVEDRNYFYAPLEGTPFTIGLSLPSKYGYNYISVRDEVENAKLLSKPLSDYFKGYNLKLRPDWVYCKYHHEHMFNSSEQELRHFIDKMSAPGWEWNEQYKTNKLDTLKYTIGEDVQHDAEFAYCNSRTPVDTEDYYCNKDLVLLLMFDAKVTCETFENPRWEFKDKTEEELVNLYNATLRFIATQSGLTRWQYMLEADEKEFHRTEFGNLHKRAIEEPWYISSVLQHQIDPDSFVYSISFDLIGLAEGDLMVTASHAIFHRDGGQEAPASVVGIQLRQTSLMDRFMKITSNAACPTCEDQCSSESLDCYVLDSNGYILISEEVANATGRFFGEFEGSIMNKLVEMEIYRKIPVYDYQALCFEEIPKRGNDASILLTPFKYLQWFIQWMFGEMMWAFAQTQLWDAVDTASVFPFDLEEEYYDSVEVEDDVEVETAAGNQTSSDIKEEEEFETINHPCDQKAELYLLNQEKVKKLQKKSYKAEAYSVGSFYISHVPYSNLVLVVIANNSITDNDVILSTEPVELLDNSTFYPCQKINLTYLPRRKLSGCFTQHPEEMEITECGDKASELEISLIAVIVCTISLIITNALQI